MALNMFAIGVWTVALVWEVIRMGGGPTQLSVVATANAVGVLLFALVAGVAADRAPQKLIVLAVATIETAVLVAVGVASQADWNTIPLLAAMAFVLGVASSFYYPAYSAWLPALVPAEDLLAVNGYEGMIRPTLLQALGPAVAGAVVGALSPSAAVGVAAVASAAALPILMLVPRYVVRRDHAGGGADASDGAPRHAVRTALDDLLEGFRYMVRTPWLLATLMFASLLVLSVMGPVEVLIPFLIKDRLGGGSNAHALVLAAFGIGSALGSIVVGSMAMPRRYLTAMILAWGLGSLPLVVIGAAGSLWLVVVAAFVLGVAIGAPMVIWGTLLQRRVPPRLLGRVSSLDFFVSLSLMPVSMALAGPLAELVGLEITFLIAGLVPPVVAVVAIVWARLPADELAHPLGLPSQPDASARPSAP